MSEQHCQLSILPARPGPKDMCHAICHVALNSAVSSRSPMLLMPLMPLMPAMSAMAPMPLMRVMLLVAFKALKGIHGQKYELQCRMLGQDSDLEAALPWLEWAYEKVKAS